MSESHLEEFLLKQELLWETQREQIRNTPERNRDKVWQEIDTKMRYGRVHGALANADNFLKANSIFHPDDLRSQFNKLVQVIWEALILFDVGNHPESKDYKMIRESWDKLKKDGEQLHADIDRAVRRRLVEQTQLADEQVQALR
jgi:hypothetical protein